jgi:Ca-activated chloride channel family protein
MTFDAAGWLWLLLLIPVGIYLWLALQRRRVRYPVAHTNVDLLAEVAAATPQWRRRVPPALFVVALALLALGFARPEMMRRVPRDEATIALAIDVSGSMRAEDVEPTRMEAAKASAASFVDKLPPRFLLGVVTFNEVAETLAQPTTDRDSALEAIASLRADGGTAMGMALAQAVDLVEEKDEDTSGRRGGPSPTPTPTPFTQPESERVAAVLLLSDGYNTSGQISPLEAAQRAKRADVPVYSIALGTPDGVIEVPDQFGNPRIVRVPPDYATLERIADVTGGEYFFAPSGDDLQAVYDSLGQRIGFEEKPEEVTYLFAGAGAVLLLAGAALSIAFGSRLT